MNKNTFLDDEAILGSSGYRLVGYEDICYLHKDSYCNCIPLPCANCYSYGPDLCKHKRWGYVSYKDMIQSKCHRTIDRYKLPWELFNIIYPGTLKDTKHNVFYMYREVISELYKKFNHSLKKTNKIYYR